MICKATAFPGRLNAFQRVMLQWSELHPYNATHTYKIAGPARPEALRDAIRATYLQHELGIVQLAADGISYGHETDYEPQVEVVPVGPSVDDVLAEHVAAELNYPFPRPRCRPLRFSVIDGGAGFHYVNATYDHWVADSVAARLILRRVLGRYCHLEIPENHVPLQLCPPTYRKVFPHLLGPVDLARATLRSMRQWLHRGTIAQPAYTSTAQMEVGYRLFQAAPGTVERLQHFARSLGATVHDVMLAALGRAMDQFLPRRSTYRDRQQALGTIVDTRGHARADLSESLGAFLAYYLVRCKPDQAASLADLTRQIAAMTGPIKARRTFFDSVVNMKLGAAIWPRLSEQAKLHFQRKVLPMTAGVSNVLLRNTWIERYGQGRILDYSRGASTGPMMPLVLSPTTLDQHMNVAVSYRTTGFTTEKIARILGAFLEQIENPTGQAVPVRRVRRSPGKSAVAY